MFLIVTCIEFSSIYTISASPVDEISLKSFPISSFDILLNEERAARTAFIKAATVSLSCPRASDIGNAAKAWKEIFACS